MIVGDAIARSGPEAVEAAVEFAQATGTRVYAEILAVEINFPTDHDQWISFLPPEERLYRQFVDADTVVFVGCSTNTTIVAHKQPLHSTDVTCLSISDNSWELGKNHPDDVALVGDPGLILRELAARVSAELPDASKSKRIARISSIREEARAVMRSMGETDETTERPTTAALVDTLQSLAPDAFVVDEEVSLKYALLTRWPFGPGQYIATKSGTLGYGVPAAVGAALAQSVSVGSRTVIAFVGDGAFQFYPQALYTAVHYDLDLTVVVIDNGGYGILRDNIVAMLGGDKSDYSFTGMTFDSTIDVLAIASGYGAQAFVVTTSEDLQESLR
jgi:benzoylformate decarboxylase